MSTEKKTVNRWFIAIAGVILQICLGTVYGWSIFVKPFEHAFGWVKPDVTLAFSIAIACLGLAAAFGGVLVDKKGPRFVAMIGACLFGSGTILTGVAVEMQSLLLIYLFYGVIAGIGLGMAYITPISVLVKWFPDKRGLITGMAVMGFGFGAFFMTTFAPVIISALSTTPGTPDPIGISKTFYILGGIFFCLTFVSAFLLKNPPQGFKPVGWEPAPGAAVSDGVSPKAALRMKEFYLFWIILFVNITAGIALISLVSPFLQEVYKQTAVAAGVTVGIFSIFNGLGRLFWSWASDLLGRRNVFVIFYITEALVFLAIPSITSLTVFTIVGCYLYSCYGGGFSTMPAFAADTFGSKNIGTIYGWILTAWSAAAIVGPMIFASIVQNKEFVIGGASGYNLAFYIAAGMFVLSLVFPLMVGRKRVIQDS